MIYFSLSTSKAVHLIVWVLLIIVPTNPTVIRGAIPNVPAIANFLQSIVGPYFGIDGRKFRTGQASFITDIIEDKVGKLKPFLQDDEVTNDTENVVVDGNDAPVITNSIEFIQEKKHKHHKNSLRYEKKEDYQADVIKFEKLKKKIRHALKKEVISEGTKDLITSTLDDMITSVLNNKCSWKSTDDHNALRSDKPKNKVEAITLANIWTQLWKHVRVQLESDAEAGNQKSIQFLDHFQNFVTNIINQTQIMTKNYKFICHLMNGKNKDGSLKNEFQEMSAQKRSFKKSNKPKPILRMEPSNDDKEGTCKEFKVCSQELKEFMSDFYYNLNDTALNTLRNYAAMFIRDVNGDDGSEKDMIIAKINKTADDVERKIGIIFKKQTDKFHLDDNKDKNENIKLLNGYLKKTINHVKKQIMKDLNDNLKDLKLKLLTTIHKDIDVNLDVDLGNLEREESSKICLIFAACNGQFLGRILRSNDGKTQNKDKVDQNSLYINVKLTLDKNKKHERKIGLSVGKAMTSSDPLQGRHIDNMGNLGGHIDNMGNIQFFRSGPSGDKIINAPKIQGLALDYNKDTINGVLNKLNQGNDQHYNKATTNLKNLQGNAFKRNKEKKKKHSFNGVMSLKSAQVNNKDIKATKTIYSSQNLNIDVVKGEKNINDADENLANIIKYMRSMQDPRDDVSKAAKSFGSFIDDNNLMNSNVANNIIDVTRTAPETTTRISTINLGLYKPMNEIAKQEASKPKEILKVAASTEHYAKGSAIKITSATVQFAKMSSFNILNNSNETLILEDNNVYGRF